MMMIIFIIALAVLAYTGARGVSRSSVESVTSAEFLKIVNQAADSRELVHAAVTFLHRQSQCEAIGIRLKDGDDFPYYEARGFPEEFVMLENLLCERDPTGKIQRDSVGNSLLACMCGNVICGRFDPAKDFFTANGSFWTNCTTRLLDGTTETERQGRTRNRCNGQGYESVALIPLGSGHRRLGLIQINDKRMGMFTPRLIALWERLAGYLSVALAKLSAEEAMRQSEERLRLFIEHAPAALAMFDREMRYLSVSRRWLRDYGLEGRDVYGISYYALSPEIPDRWREIHRRGLAGDVVQADEDSFQRADGSMQWLRWEVRPWQDASGQVGGIVIFSEDITDGKRAEQALRQTMTEMERSNKELEQFAYICAHDLQEPLRQVRGFVGLIKERHADRFDGKAAQYFDFVSDGAARMSALVSGLLAYSRDVSLRHLELREIRLRILCSVRLIKLLPVKDHHPRMKLHLLRWSSNS
jgi:PAS domain S-box-containing protein